MSLLAQGEILRRYWVSVNECISHRNSGRGLQLTPNAHWPLMRTDDSELEEAAENYGGVRYVCREYRDPETGISQ